jgi:DNA-binding GntR family transcriptional regulator
MDNYMKKLIKLVDLSQDMPLNQIVYNGLRAAIIKGVIPVGERINEKKYSLELNVSRTPIREALYRIQSEGLIEHIANYGFVIKKVTTQDADEIFKLRVALDTLASVNAMQLMTSSDFKEMKSLLDKTEEREEAGDVTSVINMFSDFNDMIYTYCNMPHLKSIIYNLKDYLARFRDISLLDDYRRKKAFDEHKLIYYCLRDKDEKELTLLISKHLGYSKKFIIEEIKKQEELKI